MNKSSRLLFALAILALIGAYFAFDLGRFFSLDYIKAQQSAIEAWRAANPQLAVGAFAAIYIAVTALSLPGAAVMTLAGGAVFGLWWGTLIISFASTIGATLAFLIARFLLRDWVQARFGDKLRAINEGMAKDGAFYLFTLRLVPLFPFFVINLVMALTPLRAWTFYWVSQVGMLAGTLVYVNAGTQLAQIGHQPGGADQGLGRHATGIQAVAAHLVLFHQADFGLDRGGDVGSDQSRRTAADHHQIAVKTRGLAPLRIDLARLQTVHQLLGQQWEQAQ